MCSISDWIQEHFETDDVFFVIISYIAYMYLHINKKKLFISFGTQ